MSAVKELAIRSNYHLKYKIQKWFPRHMNKGFRDVMKTIRKVDCIVEVHDARIPFSGRNLEFIRSLTSIKPHVLILTKVDLMDMIYKRRVKDKLEYEGNSKCLFIDSMNASKELSGFSQILPTVVEIISNSNRFNREDATDINLMIIGIPNVGKSTLINRMRHTYLGVGGRATVTGATAGVTRSVLERIKINAIPPVYLFDTPGVLDPKVDKDIETIMRCALCATLNDNVIGIENIADYLLYWMNRHKNYNYVNHLGLDTPSDDIREVLIKGSVYLKNLYEIRCPQTGQLEMRPQLSNTANVFVTAFRKGLLGRVLLDDDIL
ncbi:mitochondrial GTPase 1-like [Oppia nitens]|uniref:mitochondrial GTPase 1-like n=1 Tax=Oppia nitens TaxID=1686743 RepID=UPI0023DB3E44|nr:mitochondrial GTPase 1-like [Oppia nitens]